MNYEYYKIFYFVGKHKNITKAAAELYSSQPAVTRAIQNLENELNCRLFVRNKTGVEITHEGRTLFDYVSVAQSQLLKGEEEVSRAVSVESGTVYLATTVTALYGFLFEFLDEFHMKKFPGVKFKISTGSTNSCIEQLRKGIADLAFVSTPCGAVKDLNRVDIKKFGDVLIAGNKFTELKGKTLKSEDLKKYPLVCLRRSMQLRQFIDSVMEENGLTVAPDIEADSADLIVPMVGHNFGLGFAPADMAKPAIDSGEVFEVKLETPLPSRKICLISDPHHPHTGASRELYRTVVNSVKPV